MTLPAQDPPPLSWKLTAVKIKIFGGRVSNGGANAALLSQHEVDCDGGLVAPACADVLPSSWYNSSNRKTGWSESHEAHRSVHTAGLAGYFGRIWDRAHTLRASRSDRPSSWTLSHARRLRLATAERLGDAKLSSDSSQHHTIPDRPVHPVSLM